MKQKISTLMDGELCGEEAELLLEKLKHHSEIRQDWHSYHLIGDALRQPDSLPSDISKAFFERLHAEPTVLAPPAKRNNNTGYFAMSAVASIMAIVFLAWLTIQIDNKPDYQQARQNANIAPAASVPANEEVNEYLLAHQELSPGSDVRGAASYIRTVAYQQTGAGK
jgi:sigma-E factor negative regulatory protein RseA